jgi:pantothenate kinase
MNGTSAQEIVIESFQDLLVGIDIGGTLVKLSIAVNKIIEREVYVLLLEKEFEEIVLEKNNLYIKKYHTSQVPIEVVEFLKLLKQKSTLKKINVTGGGSFKFNKLLNVSESNYLGRTWDYDRKTRRTYLAC